MMVLPEWIEKSSHDITLLKHQNFSEPRVAAAARRGFDH
jgi:hypothetical protein